MNLCVFKIFYDPPPPHPDLPWLLNDLSEERESARHKKLIEGLHYKSGQSITGLYIPPPLFIKGILPPFSNADCYSCNPGALTQWLMSCRRVQMLSPLLARKSARRCCPRSSAPSYFCHQPWRQTPAGPSTQHIWLNRASLLCVRKSERLMKSCRN